MSEPPKKFPQVDKIFHDVAIIIPDGDEDGDDGDEVERPIPPRRYPEREQLEAPGR